jgi:hypothetical protein
MTTIGRRSRCKTQGCGKPATRKGLCGAHYMKSYRAAQAKREAADAICATRGCRRPAEPGRRGLCRPCYQKRWETNRALEVDLVRPATKEDLEALWGLVSDGVPVHDAARILGVKVEGQLLNAIRSRADAEGVDLNELERGWAEAKKWAEEFAYPQLAAELKAELEQGLSLEKAARKVGVGNLELARTLVA